jgi:hypothetical protein
MIKLAYQLPCLYRIQETGRERSLIALTVDISSHFWPNGGCQRTRQAVLCRLAASEPTLVVRASSRRACMYAV